MEKENPPFSAIQAKMIHLIQDTVCTANRINRLDLGEIIYDCSKKHLPLTFERADLNVGFIIICKAGGWYTLNIIEEKSFENTKDARVFKDQLERMIVVCDLMNNVYLHHKQMWEPFNIRLDKHFPTTDQPTNEKPKNKNPKNKKP